MYILSLKLSQIVATVRTAPARLSTEAKTLVFGGRCHETAQQDPNYLKLELAPLERWPLLLVVARPLQAGYPHSIAKLLCFLSLY